MKTFKKVAILSTMIAPLMLSLTSCDDLFNPAPENFKGEEDLKEMERQQKLSVAYKSPYKYMELWFN